MTVADKVYDKTVAATLNTGSAAFVGVVPADVVTIAQSGWASAGSLRANAQYPIATRLTNGKVLVEGGSASGGSGGFRGNADLFDAALGTWSPTGSLVTPRALQTATLLSNGKVLIVGGSNGNQLASAEVYDPALGTWSATGSLTNARQAHTATLLANGKVLVAGGFVGGASTSVELYDPALGTWSATGSLTTARYYHSATLLPDGKVLVAGGIRDNGTAIASTELYNPATGTWSPGGSFVTARYYQTATMLATGKVLVAGGYPVMSPVNSAEVYDPSSNTWSQTGGLSTPRGQHTATLLGSGKVLVVGGYQNFVLGSSELYDPAVGTWSLSSTLTTGRIDHDAALLPDGTVLVVGGDDASFAQLASAERFTVSPSATFGTATVGANKPVTVSDLSLAGASAGNYTLTQPTGVTASISAKTLMMSGLTASARAYDATTTATLGGTPALLSEEAAGTGSAGDGKPYSGDAVSLAGTPTGTFATSAVGTNKPITVGGNTLAGAAASNYALTQQTGLTASITTAALTATLTATGKTYDGTPTESNGSMSCTLGGVAAGDAGGVSCALTAGTFDSASAGPRTVSATVTISGTAVGNYTLGAAGTSVTSAVSTAASSISQASSTTVVTCPTSVSYTGAALTPCTAVVTGVGGLSLTPAPAYASNTNAGTASASYTFTGDTNHAGSSDSKNIAITQVSSTTVVTCPGSVTYSGSALTPCTAVVTGVGGLSLTPAPTYASNTNAGTASASYTFGGDTNHAGSSGSATFTIAQLALTVTGVTVANKAYDGTIAAGVPNTNGAALVGAVAGDVVTLASTIRFVPAGSMAQARNRHTATRLANGKVLVAAGQGYDTAELYDPALGSWSSTGGLNTGRSYHTATLLGNGKVLVAGGVSTAPMGSAELYDPALGTWSATPPHSRLRSYTTRRSARGVPRGVSPPLATNTRRRSWRTARCSWWEDRIVKATISRAPSCTTRHSARGARRGASPSAATNIRRRCWRTAKC